jgi:hypothetical protein
MCYRLTFAIAIDFLVFFSVATHEGLVVDRLYHLYYPILCYSLPYHWTVYTELASAVKQLMGVLFGFLAFAVPPQSSFSTLQIITLTKVFLLALRGLSL